MELMLNGEKLDVPDGTALVMLVPEPGGEGFNVTTMILIGEIQDEVAVTSLATMARGLAYLTEEHPEEVLETGRFALAQDDTELPARTLLVMGVDLSDLEPEGAC